MTTSEQFQIDATKQFQTNANRKLPLFILLFPLLLIDVTPEWYRSDWDFTNVSLRCYKSESRILLIQMCH